MSARIFLSFNGNAKEALKYYTKVFSLDEPEIMTYGDAEKYGEKYPKSVHNLVCYSSIKIGETIIMIGDETEKEVIHGNNFTIVYMFEDVEALKKVHHKLAKESEVITNLKKTFWSEAFSEIKDPFGFTWNLSM